jgi:hypothetical protein
MEPQSAAVYFGQRLFRYRSSGELLSSPIFALPASEHFIQAAPPSMGGVVYWDLAFGRRMTIRAFAGGVLTGDGSSGAIEQRTPAGLVVRTHRVDQRLEPVTGTDREAFRRRLVEGSKPAERARMERMAAEMPYPRHKPAYRRFETDDSGRIWIECYTPLTDGGTKWIRLDPREHELAEFHLPPGFRVFAFSADLVYGVWRNDDDLEHVQAYSISTERR